MQGRGLARQLKGRGVAVVRRLSPSCRCLIPNQTPFPVPSSSHAACGFPALRAPVQFSQRLWLIAMEPLSDIFKLATDSLRRDWGRRTFCAKSDGLSMSNFSQLAQRFWDYLLITYSSCVLHVLSNLNQKLVSILSNWEVKKPSKVNTAKMNWCNKDILVGQGSHILFPVIEFKLNKMGTPSHQQVASCIRRSIEGVSFAVLRSCVNKFLFLRLFRGFSPMIWATQFRYSNNVRGRL